MQEPTLKPCPFCGGKSFVVADESPAYITVSCLECGAEGPSDEGCTKTGAIEAWNRRAEPQAPAKPDGCKCWIDHPNEEPSDDCVLDYGDMRGCTYAMEVYQKGGREHCEFWRLEPQE